VGRNSAGTARIKRELWIHADCIEIAIDRGVCSQSCVTDANLEMLTIAALERKEAEVDARKLIGLICAGLGPDATFAEDGALFSDISGLTAEIVQAYSEFVAEIGSFANASAIDVQIRSAMLFSKASAGLALKAASSPNIKNNLLRISSHLAIAEDLMRYGVITQATIDRANTTKTRTNVEIGQANVGYGLSSISAVAPASIGSIAGGGNPQPMTSQTGFAALSNGGTLPYEVGGLSVTVRGVAVPVLYASPWAIKFLMPAEVALGTGEIIVSSQDGYICQGLVSIERNGSRILTTTDDDNGIAVVANGQNLTTSNFEVVTAENLGSDKRTRLSFFASGISGSAVNTNTSNDVAVGGIVRANFAESITVEARLNSGQVLTLPVEFAGVQGTLPGLDQITVILTPELRGAGTVQLSLIVGGQRSNAPTVTIK
jgi:uncharacterized protein (TIGR03437 family)